MSEERLKELAKLLLDRLVMDGVEDAAVYALGICEMTEGELTELGHPELIAYKEQSPSMEEAIASIMEETGCSRMCAVEALEGYAPISELDDK